MTNFKKLKIACLAGADAIHNNKKYEATSFVYDVNNKYGERDELSFYKSNILLRLLSDCISDENIDLDKLQKYIDNLDNYKLQ